MPNFDGSYLGPNGPLFDRLASGRPVTANDRALFAALPKDQQDGFIQNLQKEVNSGLRSQASVQPIINGVGYQNPQARQQQSVDKIQQGVQGNIDSAEADRASNQSYFDQWVQPDIESLNGANFNEIAAGRAVLGERQSNTQNWQNTQTRLDQELRGFNQQAVNERNQSLSQFTNAGQAYQGLNNQNLGTYLGETDPLMNRLTAGGYGANVQNDAEGLGLQRAAYQQGANIAGGSLDYTAAQATFTAAQLTQAKQTLAKVQYAKSNPHDVKAQQEAADALKATSKGALDAVADPEAIAAQKKALGKFDELSNPEVTAQERFIYEQARRASEQQDQANRTTLLEDMGRRGVRSGAAETAGLLQSRQLAGEDRVLAELGAQANAVGRAQRNLEQYAGLGSDIRQQSFGEMNANMDRRFAAQGAYGGMTTDMRNASDNMNMFNTNAYNQNQQFNAAQANDISMFNAGQANTVSMFNAGQQNATSQFNAGQTNNARANNQATRLGGANIQANQANAIRTANDDIAKFNKEQSLIQQRFQDSYQQNESIRIQSVAGDRNNARTTAAGTNYGVDRDLYDARSATTNSNEISNTAPGLREKQTADDVLQNWNAYGDQAEQEAERPGNLLRSGISTKAGAAGTRSGIVNTGGQAVREARYTGLAGDAAEAENSIYGY